jgi:hypothetical protein
MLENTDVNEVLDNLVGLGGKIKQLEHDKEIPQVFHLEGVPYVTANMKPLLTPLADPVTVATLTGLVGFLVANVDDLIRRDLICHVVNPTTVEVYSKITGAHKQRETYVRATADFVPTITLDRFMPTEDFNLMLQSCFVDDEERAKVLKVTSNTVASSEVANADNGVSQEVSIKAGVRKLENADVPNPVILKPYRTFTDVDQPSGKFVLRMKHDEQRGIMVGLWDATGGAWKGEAMDSIRHYIQQELAAYAADESHPDVAESPANDPAASNSLLDISIIA